MIIKRWIFSPLEFVPSPMVEYARSLHHDAVQAEAAAARAHEDHPEYELPVCRQYAHFWNAPWHHDGFALVFCEMDATHFAAAQKDPRLIICDSIHASDAVHEKIAQHHSVHGSQPGQTLKQVLRQLEKLHMHFVAHE
jgi:hypothetical protein